MQDTKIAIVILNYNGGQLLYDCVKSFLGLTYPSYQILVVDNASADNSAALVEHIDPKVTLLRATKNLGYTGGNNLGMQYALDAGFDYILVVNNDTIVINPGFLEQMLTYAAQHADAGMLGPKVYFREVGTVQNTLCAMPFFRKTLQSWLLQRLRPQRIKSGDKVAQAEVLNGVCILIRSSFLKTVGLFDDAIFMYREDTDLALRGKNKGWNSYYVPVESIVHLQKSTGYEYTSMVNFLLKRNAVYVLYKNGYYLDAYGQMIGGLSLSIARAIGTLFSFKKNKSSYFRFTYLLFQSYLSIIFRNVNLSSFGPPNVAWQDMIMTKNGK